MDVSVGPVAAVQVQADFFRVSVQCRFRRAVTTRSETSWAAGVQGSDLAGGAADVVGGVVGDVQTQIDANDRDVMLAHNHLPSCPCGTMSN